MQLKLAYIDRPHLAKTSANLAISERGQLTHMADKSGLTNHKIGEDFISSGGRDQLR